MAVATGSAPARAEPGVARTTAPSLLARLLLGAALALGIALSLIALAVDRGFRGAAESALKERLESVVFLILSTIDLDEQGLPIVADSLAEPRLDQPGSGLHAGAMTPHGQWSSPSLVGVTQPPRARLLDRGEELFRGPDLDGTWYVYAIGLGWEQPDGDIVDLTIWAAEDPGRFQGTVAGFRGDLWRWMILSALLVIVAQLVILLLLLKPLTRVAQEVAEIEAGRRDALEHAYPRELQPLTANLNALLATERDNASHYRRALADLAHALKTPLAVMRARLEGENASGAGELSAAVDDMDLLLRRQLERAARSTRRTLNKPVEVLPVLRRLADSLARLYADRGLQVEVQGDEALTVRVDARDLMELCGNLMDNAAKYGQGKLRASVRRGRHGTRQYGVKILIEDDGPGIEPERFGVLLARGVRGDERREGQGLGLAIAQELVEAYAGTLDLIPSELGGTAIRVSLPPR
ncbi:MAG: two-component sensor histidine kinase [Wenzhouxiangella sp.]|nr:MAG: two-component sensor histidine kinase [Wenzhouxiangella sp.]